MEDLNTVISGRVLGALDPAKSTGLEPGKTDASKSLTVSADSPRVWLLSQDNPKVADEAMCRSLISSFGVRVSLRSENRFPPEGGYYEVVTGCNLICNENADTGRASEFMRGCLTGPTRSQADGWLAILQAACARRRGSEGTASVTLALYASTLMEYPADVAKAVCLKLARGHGPGTNWFPTLGEVVAAADKLANTRRVIVNDGRFLPFSPPREPMAYVETTRGPTEADRAAIGRMLEEYKASRPEERAAPVRLCQGVPDETGITPELRAILASQRAA